MSISTSIDVVLYEHGVHNQNATEIIKVLMNFGWNLVHYEYISYIPHGNNLKLERIIVCLYQHPLV